MGTHVPTRDALLSLDDFLDLPEEDAHRLELAHGRLVREPAPGPGHSRVAGRVYRALFEAGQRTGTGEVFFDMGFLLTEDPPTVRVPDVAFVHADRIPRHTPSKGFWTLAPDLAAEVVSPSNTASGMQQKALDYLHAGSRLVWILDPGAGAVTVYRSTADIHVLEPGDTLAGDPVLPDLAIEVADLLA